MYAYMYMYVRAYVRVCVQLNQLKQNTQSISLSPARTTAHSGDAAWLTLRGPLPIERWPAADAASPYAAVTWHTSCAIKRR